MKSWIMASNGAESSNWHLGLGLAALAVLYVAAVIVFIILY